MGKNYHKNKYILKLLGNLYNNSFDLDKLILQYHLKLLWNSPLRKITEVIFFYSSYYLHSIKQPPVSNSNLDKCSRRTCCYPEDNFVPYPLSRTILKCRRGIVGKQHPPITDSPRPCNQPKKSVGTAPYSWLSWSRSHSARKRTGY